MEMENIHTMSNDTTQSACIATEHLLNLGRERIAYVSFANSANFALLANGSRAGAKRFRREVSTWTVPGSSMPTLMR